MFRYERIQRRSRRYAWWCTGMAAGLALVAVGCGDDDGPFEPRTPEKPPARLVEIDLGRTTVEMQEGAVVALHPVLLDQYGRRMHGRDEELEWHTSAPEVVVVDPRGGTCALHGVGPGTAYVRANIDHVDATLYVEVVEAPPPPTGAWITVHNVLVEPVLLEIDGEPVAQVRPRGTWKRTDRALSDDVPLRVTWSLVRPLDDAGQPMGEVLSGAFPLVRDTADTYEFQTAPRTGEGQYFAPTVVNRTSSELLLGVNMGLIWEQRCDCIVGSGGDSDGSISKGPASRNLGYHRLVSGSNVQAFAVGSGHVGALVHWQVTGSDVGEESGQVTLELVLDVNPTVSR